MINNRYCKIKMASVTIKFDRSDKYYEPGDMVAGTYIYDEGSSGCSHQGVVMNIWGYLDTVSVIRGMIWLCIICQVNMAVLHWKSMSVSTS